MLQFRKVPLAKKVTNKRNGGGGEYQQFPSKTFCLTVPKFSVGKLFSVSLLSGIEKVWIRGGGGSEYQDSPSKKLCLRVPKTFVEEPLCAVFQKFSKSGKVYGSEAGRRVSSFSVENFLSHSDETFCRGTLLRCVSKNFR